MGDMTTTLAPDIDLDDWVTFSGDDHTERCGYRDCGAQAVCVGVYDKLDLRCPHPSDIPYCLRHRDVILEQAAVSNDLFYCRRCGLGVTCRFLRMVPL